MRILRWGIYATVFCLPMYLVKLVVFGVPTTILELMIYFLFIGWLVKELRIGNPAYRQAGQESRIKRFKKFIVHNSLFIIPIGLILIGVSLATIFSSDLRTSAGVWKAWFVDPILFFVVLVSVIKNSEQVKKVLFSLFLSGTVVSIVALIYLILGKLDSSGRLEAFYNSPNYLAMYLAPALVIGIWGLLSEGICFLKPVRRPSEAPHSSSSASLIPTCRDTVPASACGKFQKTYPFAFILLSVVCLLLSISFTYSFGAWLGIIGTIGFGLTIYLYKLKRKKLIWIIVCLGLIAILGLGYLKFHQPEADQSLNARLVIWQKALEIFKNSPIFGIGPGTFGNYFPSYPEWGVPQPHNLYLAFLLQTGILGFIGFIWLLIWFFGVGLKNISTLNVRIFIGLMSMMVYILVHGLVDTTYWKNDLAVIFWMVIGLMAILRNLKSQITNISNKF